MPNTPRPNQVSFDHGDQTQAAFKPSPLDIVIHEGTVISPDDKRINGAVVVRQGVVSIETDMDTPEGIKTVVLDHVEAGEYFFEHLLFGFKNESSLKLRYRAQKRSVVIVVTREMLLHDPTKTAEVCGNMLRTRNREADRLRMRVYNRQASLESEASKAESLALATLKTVSEDLAQDLETANFENQALQSHINRLNDELTRVGSVLSEASRENQELWRYVRTLEGKAMAQEKQIASLNGKIAILECEDARKAFRELTAEILRAQEATASAEQMEQDAKQRMNLMQRGFELLSTENPKAKMSMTVMLLLLGEEPPNLPPNPEFDAKPTEHASTQDEFDRIFDDMPIPMPAPPAKPTPARRPLGLSSKVTVPPKANVETAPVVQQLPIQVAPSVYSIIDRSASRQTATHDSMPEITYAQEEADTGLREIMRQAGEPVRQATLMDPYEVASTTRAVPPEPFRLEIPAVGFAEDEARTTPMASPPASRRGEMDDLNKTRTFGAVRIDPPPDDTEYEVIGDDELEPLIQTTREFDVSGFRNRDDKKDGR